jgi:hypothetical protein
MKRLSVDAPFDLQAQPSSIEEFALIEDRAILIEMPRQIGLEERRAIPSNARADERAHHVEPPGVR